jgi:(E)-4-hydroxy-3-methylbut-2-enyl-diphosphate synthase
MTSLLIKRKQTRRITLGNVAIGNMSPIAVQSMTNTYTEDVSSTVAQIKRLENAGCEIVRVAVPHTQAATSIALIKKQISIPIIADIHFDYRLAIASAKAGADALRINPGNIGGGKKVKAIIDCAKDVNIPVRIGVNSGSVEKDILRKYKGPTSEALVESALRYIDIFESFDFHQIKLSIKASDVLRTIEGYSLLASKTDYPLHIGVTEAGTLFPGVVKSSIGIGMLLAQGIGDTLRVSLTRDPVDEVRVGFEILKALKIRSVGPDIISCPTCGRCKIDLFGIVDQVENALLLSPVTLKIAIMGCVVNGPGEAKEADIGIAGGDGTGILFKKGKVVKQFPQDKLIEVLLKEIDKYPKTIAKE